MVKTKSYLSLVAVLALTASSAWAAFTPAQVVEAGKVAVEQFTTTYPEHVQHFTGVKSWKSGEDAQVKVYMDHAGMAMEMGYACQLNGAQVECQETP